ncbi:MAG TPA: aspartate--tRNA(Asn) ligase [archaeon]|nr:aspartate--tRNA(Asn) ligase [archaeon]
MEKYIARGYVSEIRNFGNLMFFILRDQYKKEQITFFKKDNPELFNKAKEVTKESVVVVSGTKKDSEQAMNGYEVIPETLDILSISDAPVPLDISGKIESGFDTRINYRYVDLRVPENLAIFKVRSKIVRAVTDFFDNQGFINMNTPKMVSNGVESGAELFEINYFGNKAFLSQSPQVYKQMMIAGGFNKVYEIGEVFRAEKSHTTRHLTEFTGIDMEMGYIKDPEEVMVVLEEMLKYTLTQIDKECKQELEILKVEIKIPEKIPRITMKEAKVILKTKGKNYPPEEDLDSEGEKMLGDYVLEKYNSEFVFLTDFPFTKRPFYHMCKDEKEDGLKITKSFDLIWKGCEISTGAQREHRTSVLKEQILEKGMSLEDMDYYVKMLSYGVPSHGGAGLGLDRITQLMLNLANVKEAVLLPRDPERLTP